MEKVADIIRPRMTEMASGNVQQGQGDLVPDVVPIAVRERDSGDPMTGEVASVERRRAVARASAAMTDEVSMLPTGTDEDPESRGDLPKGGMATDGSSWYHHLRQRC